MARSLGRNLALGSYGMDVSDRRQTWEEKWSRPDYQPGWRVRSIPAEVREAVEQRWFPPGASLLDIGCGSGEISAWLARQGLDVVGADFSGAAVARAQLAYRDVARLSFRTVDICRESPQPDRFNALLDRGCLHGIPPEERADYLQYVAAAARPAARFLLIHRLFPNRDREKVTVEVEALCSRSFELVRSADTVLGHGERQRPGVAFWMIRR